MRRMLLLVVVAAAALASASCHKLMPSQGRASKGNRAPDFEAKDADGESFKLSDYRGKVVLLDFWFER